MLANQRVRIETRLLRQARGLSKHRRNVNKACARAVFETNKLLSLFLCPFSYWHVEERSSQHTALKVDVIGPENILFAGTSLHLSARKFYRLGQWRG